MTAPAEGAPVEVPEATPHSELDEALWQAWKTLELPEGFHAEIVEGFIEVSPTGGRRRHAMIANRLRNALVLFLRDSDHAAYQDPNVIHDRKVFIPDLIVAPEDLDEAPDEEGLGVAAEGIQLVVEASRPAGTPRSATGSASAAPMPVRESPFTSSSTTSTPTARSPC